LSSINLPLPPRHPSPYDAAKRPMTTPNAQHTLHAQSSHPHPPPQEDTQHNDEEEDTQARTQEESFTDMQNAAAQHMMFMKTNVAEMRDTLQAVTGMLLERGIIDRDRDKHKHFSTGDRPSTSPALSRITSEPLSKTRPLNKSESTIYVMEDAKVNTQFGLNQEQSCILKFIRGEVSRADDSCVASNQILTPKFPAPRLCRKTRTRLFTRTSTRCP
jgi:hypothetical protein